jgi:restriction system protein
MGEQTIWGIHGGRTGDADTLFLNAGLIGIGWADLGDLSKLGTSREMFKEAVAKAWPEKKRARCQTTPDSSFGSSTS